MALNCGVLRIEAFVATWSGKFKKTFPRSSIVVWAIELNFTELEIDSASLLRQGDTSVPIEGRRYVEMKVVVEPVSMRTGPFHCPILA